MRIPQDQVFWVGQTDVLEQLKNSRPRLMTVKTPMSTDCFTDLTADCAKWIKRNKRILVNEPNFSPAYHAHISFRQAQQFFFA